MGGMMRSGVLLAVLVLTLQASDLPYARSSDAPAGLVARRSLKEAKAVVSQASDLLSPSTSDAPAGLAAGSASKEDAPAELAAGSASKEDAPARSASKEGEAVAPPASDLPVPSRANASSGPSAAETVPKEKKREAADKKNRDRLVLIFANFVSLMSSLCPFVLRWGYGSWYITRQIFPAKGVACNFIASGAWTVYMVLEMYAEKNYAGQDALMVNCLTMGFNLVTLFIYFLHGGETKKFWVSFFVFLTMACTGLVGLVWHPNTIRSDTRKTGLKKDTEVFGGIGIALFVIVNLIPFADLVVMTTGGRSDFYPLLVPIMMNTYISTLADCLWTIYAWLFSPQKPNLFMYANCMATVMTFIQAIWFSILCFKHKEVEGQIREVESLRSVLIGVSNSLDKLRAAPDTVWNKKAFLISLQESLRNGVQSLFLIENTFRKLQSDLNVKKDAGGLSAAVQAATTAAIDQYPILIDLCKASIAAFEALEKAVAKKSSDPSGDGVMRTLKEALQTASAALKTFTESLKPCMQLINASQEGIPNAVQVSFDSCREKMVMVKAAAHIYKLEICNVCGAAPPAATGVGTGLPTGAGTGAATDAGTGLPTGAGTGAATDAGTGLPTGAGTGAATGAGTGAPTERWDWCCW